MLKGLSLIKSSNKPITGLGKSILPDLDRAYGMEWKQPETKRRARLDLPQVLDYTGISLGDN